MGRQRTRAAVRKARHAALDRARAASEPRVIAEGVRVLAVDLEAVVTPGSLWWAAPNAFVAEQSAPRICRMAGLPGDRADDVAAYVHAALNEFLVSLVEGFDVQHFSAWSAAQVAREGEGASG